MAHPVRIAAVHLSALPFESAFPMGEIEDSDARIAAVRADLRGRAVLIDVSRGARRCGIVPGMTMTEARARAPELEVRMRQPDVELTNLHVAAELLFQFGSIVEVAPPAFLYVEVGRSRPGLEKRLGPDFTEEELGACIVRVLAAAGHDVTVAIARDSDTARTFVERRTLERRAHLAPPPPKHGSGRRGSTRRPAKSAAAKSPPSPSAHPRATRASGPAVHAPLASGLAVHAPVNRSTAKPPRAAKRHRDELSPVVVVPAGAELQALSRLPVDALTWTDTLDDPEGAKREGLRAILASLRVLGISDVSALRMLPSDQVATRFGVAGALMMMRASAALDRPLRPFKPPEQLVESHEIEGSIEELEPMLFILKRIFSRLEARLEARGLAASSLLCTFEIVPSQNRVLDVRSARRSSPSEQSEIEIVLARPSRRAATMLSLAREMLGGALPGAVRAIRVEARQPARDRGAQLDLFSAYAKKLEDVTELVGRLVAAFGAEAVFSPEVADTHRPEAAWRPRPFEIERALEGYRMERPTPRPPAPREVPALVRDLPRAKFALPEVGGDLSVAVMPKNTVESVLEALEDRKKAWPKPVERRASDEPPPKLPPRPLELLTPPERATILLPSNAPAGEAGVLLWRGQRLGLTNIGGCERLESEWWTTNPLQREYVVAEISDGRKLWLFHEPSGDTFVHGVFD